MVWIFWDDEGSLDAIAELRSECLIVVGGEVPRSRAKRMIEIVDDDKDGHDEERDSAGKEKIEHGMAHADEE